MPIIAPVVMPVEIIAPIIAPVSYLNVSGTTLGAKTAHIVEKKPFVMENTNKLNSLNQSELKNQGGPT
jgi:hypothetical protein